MIERIGIVFRKEVIDALRDRRALVSALFYPLLGPVMLIILFTVLGRSIATQAEQTLELPIVGADNAPGLVAFFEEQGVVVLPPPENPQSAVQNGDHSAILVIEPGFTEAFQSEQPAPIQLILDSSRQTGGVAVGRVNSLLNSYAEQVGATRLAERGIEPQIIETLAVEQVDVATPQSRAALFLNIAPYFIIFAVFLGGSGIAIDSTVGERERGSLEALLINPIPRHELVLGKLAATLLFTLISVVETVLAFALVLNLMPIGDAFGVEVSFAPSAAFGILLIAIPMMLMAAALQMIIATASKGFKEAQNYLMFLPLIPALPGLFLAFVPFQAELWTMLVPTFGQQLLISQLIRGEAISLTNALVSTLVTVGVGVVLALFAIRQYQRESVLFKS